MRTHLTLLICSLLLFGCSPDVPLIDSFVDEWRLLATRGGTDFTATVVPDGAELQYNPNNVDLGASPAMKLFRNNVYVVVPDRPWIIAYDAESIAYSDTIFTFNVLDGATDICFANATTAYATSPKSSCVGVIDLTTSTVARTIKTPGKPQQIACLGNQICVTIPDSNSVVIIDSRTNEIVDKLQVGERPWYVREDPVTSMFCIVSLGFGKIDTLQQTTPTISFLSATTREIVKNLNVAVKVSEGPKQFPRGLIVSSSQFAYIPVQSGLLRVSTRTRSRVSSVQSEAFDLITYNDARAEIICQRATGGTTPNVVVLDEDGSTVKFTIPRTSRATSLLGVPR